MSSFEHLSDPAADLAFDALDYGMENARMAPSGFIPFAFVAHQDGTREGIRFVAGNNADLAECVATGRENLATVAGDVRCVALTWDGYLTYDGRRSEAVYVEVYEIGQPAGVLLAQRYVRSGTVVQPDGDPLMCGSPEPLVRMVQPSAVAP